jgi:hypothetical protein
MRNPAAIPDEMDYWIRRHAIQVSSGTRPAQHQRSLKDQYDALAFPMPPHFAALIEQLKMQK